MSENEGRKNQHTAKKTIAKIAASCMRDKEVLTGKDFRVISEAIRKEYPSLYMSDSAIVDGMEAAGIPVIKNRQSGRGIHKTQSHRAIAAIILRLCETIEVKANLPSLLTKDDVKVLNAIRSGKLLQEEDDKEETAPTGK